MTSGAVASAMAVNWIVREGNTLVGNGKYNLKVIGNMVELDVWGLKVTSTGDNTIINIPTQYRPSKEIGVWGQNGSGNINYSEAVYFTISSTVYFYAYNPPFGQSYNQLHATWFLNA